MATNINMTGLNYFMMNFDDIDKILNIEGIDSNGTIKERNLAKIKFINDNIINNKYGNIEKLADKYIGFLYYELYEIYGIEGIITINKNVFNTSNYYIDDSVKRFITIVENESIYRKSKLTSEYINYLYKEYGDLLLDDESKFSDILSDFEEKIVAESYYDTINKELDKFYISYHRYFRYIIFWDLIDNDKIRDYYMYRIVCGVSITSFIKEQLDKAFKKIPNGVFRVYINTIEPEARSIIANYLKNDDLLKTHYNTFKKELDN